jgi:protein Jumonji
MRFIHLFDFQVPPYMLTDRNVNLCRTEQQPGQFVVVFPRAYTSSVCAGYTVSESVYFATNSWLDTAHLDFKVCLNDSK